MILSYLKAVSRAIDELQTKMEKLMNTAQDFLNALADIDAETTRIATKWEEFVAKLDAGGLTDAEESTVLDEMRAAAARLKTIAADPTNPVPTPQP